MAKHVFLSLAIHNHQPVGNFDFVFEDACRTAYEPMISALERHPAIRLALHYTGPLRDWLAEHRPEILGRVRALVARGQVEMLSGGYYEPVLAVIPDADKAGQIRKLSESVWEDFGYRATGAWLAERVWEPHLPIHLARAGIEYTIVDDTHFRYVGLSDQDLFGYYVTEEQGETLKVFGSSKYLRYTIPWASVDEIIEHLRTEVATDGCRVAFMGDDGEKFGLWPGTYEHCWVNGWMDRFFDAIEANGDWLTIIPPGDFARQWPSIGRVYLPTASYDEMGEWALPAKRSRELISLKHRLQDEGRRDVLSFISGGFWRNFMVKYPEINTMHKKMLLVSRKVWSLEDGEARERALNRLWQGQCNCPYWHGVFGGVYLFHIRAANFGHLIAAETLADASQHGDEEWLHWCEMDFDGDSAEEVLLSGDAMNLYFAPRQGGQIFEWDWRAKECNLVNTLARRREGYHQELLDAGRRGAIALPGQSSGELESIHTTVVRAKESGLDEKLYHDWYRRSCLIDHFFQPGTSLEAFYRAEYGESGDFVDQPYAYTVNRRSDGVELRLQRDGHVWQGKALVPLRVEKSVLLVPGRTDVRVAYRLVNPGSQAVQVRFGVETNWAMLGGNGPHAHYGLPDGDSLGLDALHETEAMRELHLVLEWKAMDVGVHVSKPATFWCFPLETISNSEAGFERVYQGSSVTCQWLLDLEPAGEWDVDLSFSLTDTG